jgi:hypothetical protein
MMLVAQGVMATRCANQLNQALLVPTDQRVVLLDDQKSRLVGIDVGNNCFKACRTGIKFITVSAACVIDRCADAGRAYSICDLFAPSVAFLGHVNPVLPRQDKLAHRLTHRVNVRPHVDAGD